MKPEPDYSRCSLDDLIDLEGHLDRDRFPERWEQLQAAISAKRARHAASAGGKPPSTVWRNLLIAYHFALVAAAFGAVLLTWWWGAWPGAAGGRAEGARPAEQLRVALLVGFAAWSALAGILLARGMREGRWLSLALLVLMVPQIRLAGLAWIVPIGPLAVVGLLLPGDSDIRPVAAFFLQLDGGPPPHMLWSASYLYINILPALGLVALAKSRGRLG
jgi:hypothetical protein